MGSDGAASLQITVFSFAKTDDVWYVDTECITRPGDYIGIAERVADMSGGRLALSDLEDHVDVEAGTAWLAFKVGDRHYKWDLKVNDDWVDPEVFVRLDEVLQEHVPGVRLIYYDLGGQDCLVLMGDAIRLEQLRAATGLDFLWMTH
ncbi:hypothetical protein [Desulfosarcina sp.]|uniref:hypothetical protein n=1 Tax=Desulfosarcina sp. TaxID=2027861 RepID=UPI003970F159